MRSFKCFSLGIVLLFPALLQAGQIYGSVSSSGAGVGGAVIEISCGAVNTPGTTARDGSYRINVPPQGQCRLTLTGYAGAPSYIVFSYANPSQYDFELVRRPDGTYELRKR